MSNLGLKYLHGKDLNISFRKEDIEQLARYIIAPPDEGIDIFYQDGDSDDPKFEVIQVKNQPLDKLTIKQNFLYMKDTIKKYVNGKKLDSQNCVQILQESDLDKNNYKDCKYYVVHTGDLRGCVTNNDNEMVLNLDDLSIIEDSSNECVKRECIPISGKKGSRTMIYGDADSKQSAIVCSIDCYTLAKLDGKYFSTKIGRNILFGGNFRESLKNNITNVGMLETLKSSPENFWYYNNGITIVADNFTITDKKNLTEIVLENFSIVNGAQTTSTLGRILRDAENNNLDGVDCKALVESLKKAHVIARILKTDNEQTQKDIATYTNTQTPINSRDMVAKNEEQIVLHERLLNDDPYHQIYMEIRRGADIPSGFRNACAHRITKNEKLAQLAFAGFTFSPFKAKSKKKSLFDKTSSQSDGTILNEDYDAMFKYDIEHPEKNGELQKRSNAEIDELLFSERLYLDCKKYLKQKYNEQIEKLKEKLQNGSDSNPERLQKDINNYAKRLEANNVCLLYFINTYYKFNEEWGDSSIKNGYDYERYYSDKAYKKELIASAAELFLSKTTIKILVEISKELHDKSIGNLLRSSALEESYQIKLSGIFSEELSLSEEYIQFIKKFKCKEN